jgi:hypothetical protein
MQTPPVSAQSDQSNAEDFSAPQPTESVDPPPPVPHDRTVYKLPDETGEQFAARQDWSIFW